MPSLFGDPNIPILSTKRKYFILSDLHLEFKQGKDEKEFWKDFPQTEAKTCLLAGDLTNVGQPFDRQHFVEICNRFHKVIYVPGNHEYYGSDPERVQHRFKILESILPNLKILKTWEPYVYEGQRFIGDTMWFPDRPEVHIYKRLINDSFQIKNLFPWAFNQSNLFMVYLRENVRFNDIVITHHIPNDKDTSKFWKGGDTEAYFLNKSCDLYCNNPNSILPKAWIYGHTHDYHLYNIGNTQFICNPVGYATENKNWQSRQLVYEI